MGTYNNNLTCASVPFNPQVIVGSFSMDTTKDVTASGSKLTSPVGGAPVSSLGFRSPVESSGRSLGRGGDDLQNMGGSHFMISPPPGMPVPSSRPMEWRSSGGYELTGVISLFSVFSFDFYFSSLLCCGERGGIGLLDEISHVGVSVMVCSKELYVLISQCLPRFLNG